MIRFEEAFWNCLDRLMAESELIVDRPRGSLHPNEPDFICPLDYGYLKNNMSGDGDNIDVWFGTADNRKINGVLCIVDINNRDSEIKIICACTEHELETIYEMNKDKGRYAILIERTADFGLE